MILSSVGFAYECFRPRRRLVCVPLIGRAGNRQEERQFYDLHGAGILTPPPAPNPQKIEAVPNYSSLVSELELVEEL